MTDEFKAAVEAVARAIYAKNDPNNSDPWDAATARRQTLGMTGLSANQQHALDAAIAALDALHAALIAAGWQIVPKAATVDMKLNATKNWLCIQAPKRGGE